MKVTSHSESKKTIQDSLSLFLSLKDKSAFFKHIIKTDYCWIWNGYKTYHGYGQFHFGPRSILAHRATYSLFKGEIKNNLFVLHKCDHRDCVNPDHLFLGTASENFLDMHAKGRNSSHIYLTGDNCVSSKLSDDEVLYIYRKLQKIASSTVASRFKITAATVCLIRSGKFNRIKRLLNEKRGISDEGLKRLQLGLRSTQNIGRQAV